MGVLGEGCRIDEPGEGTAECEGCQRSDENAVAARGDDPDEHDEAEGQKEMRLERAEPESRAGQEGVRAMEAQKEHQAEEQEDGGLAHDDALQSRGKSIADPFE